MTSTVEQIPFERYAESPETHATALKHILVSPRAYQRYIEGERKPETDAQREGRAIHTAVYEPMRFLTDYALWEGGVRRGREWDAFCEKAGRKTILTKDQYAAAVQCQEVVRNHPIAGKLLAEKGKPELSIRWTHERTGLAVKCRVDWLCSALVDLKSTKDPSPRAFGNDAARYEYFMQLGLYHLGVMVAGLGELPVKLIALQKEEPLDVVVYSLDNADLEYGVARAEKALDILASCIRDKAWPGIAHDTELPLMVPKWAKAGTLTPTEVTNEDIPY